VSVLVSLAMGVEATGVLSLTRRSNVPGEEQAPCGEIELRLVAVRVSLSRAWSVCVCYCYCYCYHRLQLAVSLRSWFRNLDSPISLRGGFRDWRHSASTGPSIASHGRYLAPDTRPAGHHSGKLRCDGMQMQSYLKIRHHTREGVDVRSGASRDDFLVRNGARHKPRHIMPYSSSCRA
jgi:hypothetical protein